MSTPNLISIMLICPATFAHLYENKPGSIKTNHDLEIANSLLVITRRSRDNSFLPSFQIWKVDSIRYTTLRPSRRFGHPIFFLFCVSPSIMALKMNKLVVPNDSRQQCKETVPYKSLSNCYIAAICSFAQLGQNQLSYDMKVA